MNLRKTFRVCDKGRAGDSELIEMRRRVPTTLALVFLLILSVGSSSDRCGDGVTAFIIALEPASSCASATRERAAEHGFDVRWHAGVRWHLHLILHLLQVHL